ncbi:hypothetical protein JCGZ_02250 [Jatropha curcas]|uniref:Uncharacterized protein n=2 Tax=Jatropha curcas TaxID=180498 RepID=A0A067KVW1_JATCU|nr:hypothetical protein JCGZ_02250 [Jatropha curcas]
MSTSVPAISINLMKKAIPIYTPNSISTKEQKPPSVLLFYAIPDRKIVNGSVYNKQNLVSLVAQLRLVNDQSNPPEFPRKPDYTSPSFPSEVPELPKDPEIEFDTSPPEEIPLPPSTPEMPTSGPDYPVPPPTPPDVPLPPRPQPPNPLPPKFPDPPTHPPPDIQQPPDLPLEIKPPPGPYVI